MFTALTALTSIFSRKITSPGEKDLKLAQKAGFKVNFRVPTSRDAGSGELFFHDGYLYRPLFVGSELLEFAFQPSLISKDKAKLQSRPHNANFLVSFA